ncbi:MAG: hypothetical protein GEV08_12300 [Acidimicrobiia bacterium]|nr:hypothetical protein [Acidimicrobiia bacterium]
MAHPDDAPTVEKDVPGTASTGPGPALAGHGDNDGMAAERLEASPAEAGAPVPTAELNETVRALRDQVIGLEAELGEALGLVTELQAVEGSYRRLSEQFEANHDEYVRSREIVAEYEAIERSRALGLVRRALKRYTWVRLKLGLGLK